MTDSIFDTLSELEADLGMQAGFWTGLLKEADDWSFVIKLHAVFEAGLAHLLAEELGCPELTGVFSRTELSRVHSGKIEIGKALGILSKKERRFLRSLSELRNTLVHDVRKTSFSFRAHLETLTKPQQKACYERFEIDVETDYVEVGGQEVPRLDFFLENPRLTMWTAASVLLEYLHVHAKSERLRRELESRYAELARAWVTPGESHSSS